MSTVNPPTAPRSPTPAVVNDRLRDFSADRRLLLMCAKALVVGSLGAGAAWVLQHLINLATHLAYQGRLDTTPILLSEQHLTPWSALVPMAGCLIIGLMARYGSEKIRGHGIPEALEAILIGRSRIQPKVAVLKPLSSAISIGSGGPFGAEGPIIMTGGALGSLFAQLFHLSSAERKTLLVAGAAAGMTATFGTPMAAMLLAVELLLFEWKPRSFVPVAISCVVAAAWRTLLHDNGVLFPMAASTPLSPWGVLAAAVLGILCGLASGVLTKMVYTSEDLFQRLPVHWMWWPLVGGLAIGLGGLVEPRALGVGYDSIAALLHQTMPAPMAIRLVLVKSIIWAIALGSGTSGGVLAPLLIMGGALGSLFGAVMPVGDPALWALIGMAAMMGGTMRAPLTAMVFAVELTSNVNALLPLATACALAHATTVLLLRRSILTEKVARRGHHVTREYSVDPFQLIRVAEVMVSPADTLRGDLSVEQAVGVFTSTALPHPHKSYPVVDSQGRFLGMIGRADVLGWLRDGLPAEQSLAAALAGGEWITGFVDETAGELADRMAATGTGRVPILRRSDGVVVGLVARSDLLRVRSVATGHESDREALIRFRVRPERRAERA